MQHDGQEGAQIRPRPSTGLLVGLHRGGHRHAIDQTVQRQSDRRAAPGKTDERVVPVSVVVAVIVVVIAA